MIWWFVDLVVPCALAAVGVALLRGEPDARSLEPWFDARTRTFPLRSHWFIHDVIHDGGQYAVVAAGAACLAIALASRWVARWRPWRGPALYAAICFASILAIVASLKKLLHQVTPWDLVRFGGSVPNELVLGDGAPLEQRVGSPGAHAALGLAWMSLYFVARARGARRPALWLAPGIALGAMFAITQHMRGAHFPSHNLWTFAIAWTVLVIFARAFERRGWLSGAA